jgi:hypothetical protein
MSKPEFLNEKEKAASDNLLDLLAGLTPDGARQTDVEAIGSCYKQIADAAYVRHTAIPNIACLVASPTPQVPLALTLHGDPVIEREPTAALQ